MINKVSIQKLDTASKNNTVPPSSGGEGGGESPDPTL